MPPVKTFVPFSPNPPIIKKQRSTRACHACRNKKIKCDGNFDGCLRCNMLGIRCWFEQREFTVRRGRPRSDFLQQHEQILFIANHPTLTSTRRKGSLLEQFQWMFGRLCGIKDMIGIIPTVEHANISTIVSKAVGLCESRLPVNKILTHDLLAIYIERTSALSSGEKLRKKFPLSHQTEDVNSYDQSFILQHTNPLHSLPHDQGLVLINQWFHVMPNSVVLSRTIMLENYQKQQYDPLLYSVVFGTVLGKLESPIYNQTASRKPGSVFIEYALSLLEQETLEPSLTKLQALLLLGIHTTENLQSKRGIALVSMAIKMAFDLRIHEQDSEQFDQKLDPVEQELRNNVWWLIRNLDTWAYFHFGSRVNTRLIAEKVKLPVMSEKESAIYALEEKQGNIMGLQEHAQAIRDFYNYAFITVIMAGIWMQINSTPKFCLWEKEQDTSEGCKILPLQQYLGTMPAIMRETVDLIPSDLPFISRAELMLYLNTISIHSHFPKTEDNLLLFLEIQTILECMSLANAIVDMAKAILSNTCNSSLHPILLFSLNTSVCIYVLVAESGMEEERREAVRQLESILQLLESGFFGYPALKLIRMIEQFLCQTERREEFLFSGSNSSEQSSQTLLPVVIPCVSLCSITALECLSETAIHHNTLLVMVVHKPSQYPPRTALLPFPLQHTSSLHY
ncbi:uncharacterized protein VTP21DRAFT_8060 [Calcarisporiella thermophila]|uniref:uncharacterized protein n=1 Tax=Calcarisporiella thermophila TaxID=911321 RepID=UPI003742C5F7